MSARPSQRKSPAKQPQKHHQHSAAVAALQVSHAALPPLRAGHPWLYREALRPLQRTGAWPRSGEVVSLHDASSALLGYGVYDASSALAVRVWTLGARPLDAALVSERLQQAFSLRQALFVDPEQTNAYRMLHGEGDRTPGWVIDRYDAVAVLRTDGEAARLHLARHEPLLRQALQAHGVRTLLHRHVATSEQGEASRSRALLWSLDDFSADPADPRAGLVTVREHGMLQQIDVLRGQKTGSFLDQRENRRYVRTLAPDRRVLNLFSYSGGFSLAAALGGARHVTSVDIAGEAHRTAQASFRLAGVDPRAHSFVTADAFQWLDAQLQKPERYDLIISDPPSFAPNEKSVSKASAAYSRLHRACSRLLAPGGIFCAASCSSHLDLSRFLRTLGDDCLQASWPLRVVSCRGAGADHPLLPAFAEGAYLKFVELR